MLKVNTSLKSLVLEWNCLGIWECGIKALADALLVNDSLEDLDLRNCKISPQGVNALSIGIKNNHRLRKLGNAGLTGGKGLLQALKSNHTLTVLSLAGNEIPDTLLQAIHSCIDRNECRAKDEENAKANANFLSSTFQQLAKSHQDTIDGLSMKLELSKEVADDARDQLRVVSNELRKMMVEKKELDLKLMDKEKQIEEASFSISELRKELLTEKEKTTTLHNELSKSALQTQIKIREADETNKELDLQVALLKKDKCFLLEELEKVKRREKDRSDLHAEKIERLEKTYQMKFAALEDEKERQVSEKCRVYEERIQSLNSQKQRLVDDIDRAKSDLMIEKHKFHEALSAAEIAIRNDEARRRNHLEDELKVIRELKDKTEEDLKSKITALKANIRDQESEIQNLENCRNALTQQMSKLDEKHHKIINENNTLCTEMSLIKKTMSAQEDQNKGLESKIVHLREEIEVSKKENAKGTAHLQSIIADRDLIIEKLRAELKKKEAEIERERDDCDERMKELTLQISSVLAQRQRKRTNGLRDNTMEL
ncbi:Leucine-rich repeat-containing protein 45 [Entophlyctis sp. JEL0112]|nr:Leucine-rich repeat-containing protein 45 [Entophlyctis sp. JEL0112]